MNRQNRVTFSFADATSLGTSGLDAGSDPSDLAERAESLQHLAGWMAGLPGDEKVLLRTLTDGWTLAQTGSLLAIDPSTVSRRRANLLEHARRALAEIAP